MYARDGFRSEELNETERESVDSLFEAYLQLPSGVALATMADVRASLDLERQKDILGCSDVTCASQIGGALGAEYVLTGTVGILGGDFLLSARVIEASTASAKGKVSVQYGGADCISAAVEAAAGAILQVGP